MVAFFMLMLSVSSLSDLTTASEPTCKTLKRLENNGTLCQDSQLRTICMTTNLKMVKKCVTGIEVDDGCLKQLYENLPKGTACICGGHLKLSQMMVSVGSLLCDETEAVDQRRQSSPSTMERSSFKITLSKFSNIEKQMSKLDATYTFARKYAAIRDENNNVPRILHFVWVVRPIPEKYLDAIRGFEKNNPDYEIYLWTDNASMPKLQNETSWKVRHVDSLNLTIPEVIEGESSEKAGWGWIGAYADLLRYEIIYNYGGIYLDTDSLSLKPFDSLFLQSFVCYDAGWNTLVNSVFGMPPKSKCLRFALESARLNFQHEEFRKRIVYLRYGPTFLGKMFFEFNDTTINIIDSRYLIWDHKNDENYMSQTNDQSWG